MTTQREFERQCWSALQLYMTAATLPEFVAPINLDYAGMSRAEFERFSKAYERVRDELDRRAARKTER